MMNNSEFGNGWPGSFQTRDSPEKEVSTQFGSHFGSKFGSDNNDKAFGRNENESNSFGGFGGGFSGFGNGSTTTFGGFSSFGSFGDNDNKNDNNKSNGSANNNANNNENKNDFGFNGQASAFAIFDTSNVDDSNNEPRSAFETQTTSQTISFSNSPQKPAFGFNANSNGAVNGSINGSMNNDNNNNNSNNNNNINISNGISNNNKQNRNKNNNQNSMNGNKRKHNRNGESILKNERKLGPWIGLWLKDGNSRIRFVLNKDYTIQNFEQTQSVKTTAHLWGNPHAPGDKAKYKGKKHFGFTEYIIVNLESDEFTANRIITEGNKDKKIAQYLGSMSLTGKNENTLQINWRLQQTDNRQLFQKFSLKQQETWTQFKCRDFPNCKFSDMECKWFHPTNELTSKCPKSENNNNNNNNNNKASLTSEATLIIEDSQPQRQFQGIKHARLNKQFEHINSITGQNDNSNKPRNKFDTQTNGAQSFTTRSFNTQQLGGLDDDLDDDLDDNDNNNVAMNENSNDKNNDNNNDFDDWYDMNDVNGMNGINGINGENDRNDTSYQKTTEIEYKPPLAKPRPKAKLTIEMNNLDEIDLLLSPNVDIILQHNRNDISPLNMPPKYEYDKLIKECLGNDYDSFIGETFMIGRSNNGSREERKYQMCRTFGTHPIPVAEKDVLFEGFTDYFRVENFERATAGQSIKRKECRAVPMQILTMQYLMNIILNDKRLSLNDRYRFIDYRIRQVTKELKICHTVDDYQCLIQVFEISIRFRVIFNVLLLHFEAEIQQANTLNFPKCTKYESKTMCDQSNSKLRLDMNKFDGSASDHYSPKSNYEVLPNMFEGLMHSYDLRRKHTKYERLHNCQKRDEIEISLLYVLFKLVQASKLGRSSNMKSLEILVSLPDYVKRDRLYLICKKLIQSYVNYQGNIFFQCYYQLPFVHRALLFELLDSFRLDCIMVESNVVSPRRRVPFSPIFGDLGFNDFENDCLTFLTHYTQYNGLTSSSLNEIQAQNSMRNNIHVSVDFLQSIMRPNKACEQRIPPRDSFLQEIDEYSLQVLIQRSYYKCLHNKAEWLSLLMSLKDDERYQNYNGSRSLISYFFVKSMKNHALLKSNSIFGNIGNENNREFVFSQSSFGSHLYYVDRKYYNKLVDKLEQRNIDMFEEIEIENENENIGNEKENDNEDGNIDKSPSNEGTAAVSIFERKKAQRAAARLKMKQSESPSKSPDKSKKSYNESSVSPQSESQSQSQSQSKTQSQSLSPSQSQSQSQSQSHSQSYSPSQSQSQSQSQYESGTHSPTKSDHGSYSQSQSKVDSQSPPQWRSQWQSESRSPMKSSSKSASKSASKSPLKSPLKASSKLARIEENEVNNPSWNIAGGFGQASSNVFARQGGFGSGFNNLSKSGKSEMDSDIDDEQDSDMIGQRKESEFEKMQEMQEIKEKESRRIAEKQKQEMERRKKEEEEEAAAAAAVARQLEKEKERKKNLKKGIMILNNLQKDILLKEFFNRWKDMTLANEQEMEFYRMIPQSLQASESLTVDEKLDIIGVKPFKSVLGKRQSLQNDDMSINDNNYNDNRNDELDEMSFAKPKMKRQRLSRDMSERSFSVDTSQSGSFAGINPFNLNESSNQKVIWNVDRVCESLYDENEKALSIMGENSLNSGYYGGDSSMEYLFFNVIFSMSNKNDLMNKFLLSSFGCRKYPKKEHDSRQFIYENESELLKFCLEFCIVTDDYLHEKMVNVQGYQGILFVTSTIVNIEFDHEMSNTWHIASNEHESMSNQLNQDAKRLKKLFSIINEENGSKQMPIVILLQTKSRLMGDVGCNNNNNIKSNHCSIILSKEEKKLIKERLGIENRHCKIYCVSQWMIENSMNNSNDTNFEILTRKSMTYLAQNAPKYPQLYRICPMMSLTKFWQLLFDESNLYSKSENVNHLISQWNVNLTNCHNDILHGMYDNDKNEQTSWPPYPNLMINSYDLTNEKYILPSKHWNDDKTLSQLKHYFDFLKLPKMDAIMTLNLFKQNSVNFYTESSNKYLSNFIENGKQILIQCMNNNNNNNNNSNNNEKAREMELYQFERYMACHVCPTMANFLQHFNKIVKKGKISKEKEFDFFLKVLIKEIICHGYTYLQDYINNKFINKYYFSLNKPLNRQPIDTTTMSNSNDQRKNKSRMSNISPTSNSSHGSTFTHTTGNSIMSRFSNLLNDFEQLRENTIEKYQTCNDAIDMTASRLNALSQNKRHNKMFGKR